MATDLGKLALTITADPNSFEAGLAKAAQSAADFAGKVMGSMQSINAAMKAVAANPIGAVLMAVAGALALIQDATGGVGNLRRELAALYAEGVRAANVQANLSRRFGLTGEAAAGLALQARTLGIDSDSLRIAMQAVSQRLGEAALSGGAAERGLERLGLSAGRLINMPLNEALALIGDRLNQVSNLGERNALRFEILGRRGAALEPLLTRGTAGMELAAAQAQAWGLAFTEAEARAVRAVTIAGHEADAAMGGLRQGIANTFAVAAAPVMTFISQIRTGFAEMAQGPLGLVRDAIRGVGAVLADMIGAFKAGWAAVQPIIAAAVRNFNEALQAFRAAFGQGDELKRLLLVVAQIVAVTLANALVGVLVILTAIVRTAEVMVGTVRGLVFLFSRGLIGGPGGGVPEATGGPSTMFQMFAAVRARAEEMAAQQARQTAGRQAYLNSLIQDRNRILEQSMTPMERHMQQLDRVFEIWSAGLLTVDQYTAAVTHANEELERHQQRRETRLAGALSAGSAEAISAINQFQAGGTPEAPIDRLRQVAEQTRELQARSVDLLQQQLRELQNRGILPGGPVLRVI